MMTIATSLSRGASGKRISPNRSLGPAKSTNMRMAEQRRARGSAASTPSISWIIEPLSSITKTVIWADGWD